MLRFFDKKLTFLLTLFCVPLLFFPKINLLNIGGETAGIRIDDVVLLGLCVLMYWAFVILNKRFLPIEKWLYLIVYFAFISFALNRLFVSMDYLNVHSKIFYVVRLIEYFLFFYLGAMSTRFVRTKTIVIAFFLLNSALIIFQKFGIVGTITTLGEQTLNRDRVTGIASFPSEMGALLTMIYCYLLYDPDHYKIHIVFPPILRKVFNFFKEYAMFLLFTVLIIFTGARIAIAAILMIFLCYQFKTKNFRSMPTLLLIGAILGSVTFYVITKTDSVFARSAELLTLNNFSIIEVAWNSVDTNIDMYDNIFMTPGDFDMSWWIRIHKWCYALKIYLSHPLCYLQGVGPGFSSAALDGSFLRILTENGIIGLILYLNFFKSIYKQSQQLKWVVIAFLFNMIFFDIYLAYKPMSWLLFLSGATMATNSSTVPVAEKELRNIAC